MKGVSLELTFGSLELRVGWLGAILGGSGPMTWIRGSYGDRFLPP